MSELEVNAHLDNDCPKLNASRNNSDGERSIQDPGDSNDRNESIEVGTNNMTNTRIDSEVAISDKKSLPRSTATAGNMNNVFQHMMKKSAQMYSNNGNIQQRFHLHNNQGMVSWISEDDTKEEDVLAKSVDTKWSATIILKNVKAISLREDADKQQQQSALDSSVQLTVSSSISPLASDQSPQQTPSSTAAATSTTTKSKLPRLVQRHSRLSISHLKSCLQKSIRRRAPLPAVRVAMELADKSWTDLIRRLPVIILEDSTLHPDFGLLVWLMVADSKGYVPSKELIVRVFQIVFEVASCPWQDAIADYSNEDCIASPIKDCIDCDSGSDGSKQTSFSLRSSASTLFPTEQHTEQRTATAESTMIRAMLLRAQYGGMKCDVDMLHSFSKLWLQRFNGAYAIPKTIASTCSSGTSSSTTDDLSWSCIPSLIHAKARQQSQNLVTMGMVNSPGGIAALTTNDVCPAGIDFHCSQVVDHLLSRPDIYSCLCERLKPLLPPKSEMNRDWITSKVKMLIWNYSSGVNRRRPLMGSLKKSDCDSVLKRLWDDVLSSPFEDYVKKFVKDRLQ